MKSLTSFHGCLALITTQYNRNVFSYCSHWKSSNRNRNRNRNRKLLISRAPTKAKSQESAYSQALNQNKIDRQRSSSRESGRQTVRRLWWMVLEVEMGREVWGSLSLSQQKMFRHMHSKIYNTILYFNTKSEFLDFIYRLWLRDHQTALKYQRTTSREIPERQPYIGDEICLASL